MNIVVAINSGSLTAAEQSASLEVKGNGKAAVQLTGTFVGTVSFEGTVDGTNWVAINMTPPNSATAASSATAAGVWVGSASALRAVRARMSAYTSGTAVVSVRVSPF